MKLFISAKPNAHETRVEKIDDTHYTVSVTAPPVQGKANRAIIQALADHFSVPPSCVALLRGHTSRQKLIEITIP